MPLPRLGPFLLLLPALLLAGLLLLFADAPTAHASHPSEGCAIPQSLQPLSGGEIDRPLTIDFSAACQELQSCYARFTDFHSFNTCNRAFDIAQRAACAEQSGIRGLFCVAALNIYSFGLENFGWPVYIYRQWIHSPAFLAMNPDQTGVDS